MNITYITAAAATLENNSDTILVTGENVDFSKADDYLVALDNGLYVLPVLSGTAPDENGNSTLTLVKNWTGATLSNKGLFIFPTFAKIYESVTAMTALNDVTRGILTKLKDLLTDTNPTLNISVGKTSSIETIPYGYLVNQVTGLIAQLNGLLGSVQAMTKAEFFALAEQRKSQSAGSGFVHFGDDGISVVQDPINYGGLVAQNKVYLSPNISGTNANYLAIAGEAIANINGVSLAVNDGLKTYTNANYGFSARYNGTGILGQVIKFPPAPDGTKTYDSSTGTVTQHASAAIAFAAETATNKVITSRQDFVFIECWHEKISDKGVVYPLGNVQYGATAYEGITLAVNGIAQGYSAFGEWDSTTTGNCAVRANLTDAQKATFIQDHKNNIYSDNGELIQVLYRVRVVEGFGDEWGAVGLLADGPWRLQYDASNRVKPKGMVTSLTKDLAPFNLGLTGMYAGGNSADSYGSTPQIGGLNAVTMSLTPFDENVAHNGLCFAIPIALVQRRNQGAYHPTYNSEGCAGVVNTERTGSFPWHESTTFKMSSLSDCFTDKASKTATGGYIGVNSGRPDNKFYDAIYESDVKDLRMSSKKLPLKEIREKYKRMAIAGEVRGFEGVPFTVAVVAGANTQTTYLAFGETKPDWWSDELFGSGSTKNISNSKDVIISDGNNTVYISSFGYTSTSNLGWYIRTTVGHGLVSGDVVCITFKGDLNPKNQHKQANPTWTDIIGSPENIAATFPDGVEGQWIPVIPDGTNDYFPLNRKGINSGKASREYTNDNGGSWTSNALLTFDAIGNITQFDNMPVTQVMLYHYETQAHFTQDDDNSKVFDLGGVAGNGSTGTNSGALIVSTLIGKIPNIAYPGHYGLDNVVLKGGYNSFAKKGDFYFGAGPSLVEQTPNHEPLNFPSEASPHAKMFDYLSSENGIAKLCYAYKEMVFDVTWGDNNQFEIADNQNTLTDDNGNTVLYGTASFDTQYFISEE